MAKKLAQFQANEIRSETDMDKPWSSFGLFPKGWALSFISHHLKDVKSL